MLFARYAALLPLSLITVVAQPSAVDPLLIETGRAGPVRIGMTVDEFYRIYPPGISRLVDLLLEGMFSPALEVLDQGRVVLTAEVNKQSRGWVIGRIRIHDPRFRTAGGLGVGSTLANLRKVYPKIRVDMGEGAWYAVAPDQALSFRLEARLDRPPRGDAAATQVVVLASPANY